LCTQQRWPRRAAPDSPVGRLGITKEVVHIADVNALKSYIEGDPSLTEPVDLGGFRTVVAVPMLKANELIGAIAIYRQEVRPFTDKQIALVQNFAAQAVLATRIPACLTSCANLFNSRQRHPRCYR
jgi:two-component system NtrC family sensor kinase